MQISGFEDSFTNTLNLQNQNPAQKRFLLNKNYECKNFYEALTYTPDFVNEN